MKKALITFAVSAFTIVSAGMVISSCNAIKDAVPAQDISFDGASGDIDIPATSDTTGKNVLTTIVHYNIDSMIEAQTSGKSAIIQSAKIKSVTLSLTNADVDNSFANFVIADLTFNTNATPGTAPYDVADIENNPNVYTTTLDLPLLSPDTDVKQYFGNNVDFTYLLNTKLRRATTKTLHCHIAVKYDLQVKLN